MTRLLASDRAAACPRAFHDFTVPFTYPDRDESGCLGGDPIRFSVSEADPTTLQLPDP